MLRRRQQSRQEASTGEAHSGYAHPENQSIHDIESNAIDVFRRKISGAVYGAEQRDEDIASTVLAQEGRYRLSPKVINAINENITSTLLAIDSEFERNRLFNRLADTTKRQELLQRLIKEVDSSVGGGLLASFDDRASNGNVPVSTMMTAARFPVDNYEMVKSGIDHWFNKTLKTCSDTTRESERQPYAELLWALGSLYDSNTLRPEVYRHKMTLIDRQRRTGDPRMVQDMEFLLAVGHPNVSIDEFRRGYQITSKDVDEAFERQARAFGVRDPRVLMGGTAVAIAAGAVFAPSAAAISPSGLPNLSPDRVQSSLSLTIGMTPTGTVAPAGVSLNAPLKIGSTAPATMPRQAPAIETHFVAGSTPHASGFDQTKAEHVEPVAPTTGVSAAAAKINAIDVLGVDKAAARFANDAKNTAPELRTTNYALNQQLTEDLRSYSERIDALDKNAVQQRAKLVLAHVIGSLKNPASMESIGPEDYDALVKADGANFAPLLEGQAIAIDQAYNTPKYDKWKGFDEASRVKITHMLAYLKLVGMAPDQIAVELARLAPVPVPVPEQPQPTPDETVVAPGAESIASRAAEQNGWTANKKLFYQTGLEMGLSPYFMAVLGGNASVESGYRTDIVERLSDRSMQDRIKRNNGRLPEYALRGKGLFQWTFERHVSMADAAKDAGVNLEVNDSTSMKFQLQYTLDEMSQRKPRDKNSPFANEMELIKSLEQKGDVAAGVWAFQYNFERPQVETPHQKRIDNGVSDFAQLMAAIESLKPQQPAAPAPAPPPEAPAPVANPGEELKHKTITGETVPDYWKGFRYFNQYDQRWAGNNYSAPGERKTIGESGCGAASLAIAISSLTGAELTPAQAAEYSMENGMKFKDEGTSHGLYPLAAKKFGLTSKAIGDKEKRSIEYVKEVTKAGGLLAVGAKDGKDGTPTRGGGHIFVIRGVTDEGKILVLDPASFNRTQKAYDADDILPKIGNMTLLTK